MSVSITISHDVIISASSLDNLDPTQRETLKAFWLALLSTIDADPLKVLKSPMGDELFFLFGRDNPDVVLLRWLRARKWQVPAAVQHMMDTLRWRHEWGVRKLMTNGENALNQDECASGKLYLMSTDKLGRTVTYFHISDHIRGQYPFESTEKCVILLMETGRHWVESHIEEGIVVIDMANMGTHNLDYQQIKFMMSSMQNYYPECLGLALVVNAPWGVNAMSRIMKPWLDPVVAKKFHFLHNASELAEHIEPASIPQRLAGNHPNYKFTPASKEEQDRLASLRQDRVGMEKAQAKHAESSQRYLEATLKWAAAHGENEEKEKLNRIEAMKQLSDAYTQLIPYVSTRTHYHRTGQIHEPILDTARTRNATDDNPATVF